MITGTDTRLDSNVTQLVSRIPHPPSCRYWYDRAVRLVDQQRNGHLMPDAASPGWNKIGLLMEGLAYAQLPIHAAVHDITKQLGLGRRGAFILNLVAEGSEYPNELATKLRTRRSLITADLTRLIDAGLIQSAVDEADKRMTRLQLSDAGRTVCGNIRKEMARIVIRNLAPYSEADLQLFTEMLVAVRQLEPGEQIF